MAITPTTIISEDQIYLAGSPINVKIQNAEKSIALTYAYCELYIWSGQLNTPPELPTHILNSNKISASDNYINFQISEILSSYIDNTAFSFLAGDNAPTYRGEGLFWQIRYQTKNGSSVSPFTQRDTNFATNGYRYDYEQKGELTDLEQPYSGIEPINYNRNYTDKVKYFKRSFDFSRTLTDCTSENIIQSSLINPTEFKCHLGDAYLIFYINRLGLWDCFTPYGKVVKRVNIDSETNSRLYRNANRINNSISHSKQRRISATEQMFSINSGGLTEAQFEQIEEVVYSPLIYLVEFNGEVYNVQDVGLTVDSTTITVDSTIYTADATVISITDIGLFSIFKQIPVTNDNKDIEVKTRLNDKGKINFDFKFNSTTDRVNNLR